MLDPRFKRTTLFIISNGRRRYTNRSRDTTHHGATLFHGTGLYNGEERYMLGHRGRSGSSRSPASCAISTPSRVYQYPEKPTKWRAIFTAGRTMVNGRAARRSDAWGCFYCSRRRTGLVTGETTGTALRIAKLVAG